MGHILHAEISRLDILKMKNDLKKEIHVKSEAFKFDYCWRWDENGIVLRLMTMGLGGNMSSER